MSITEETLSAVPDVDPDAPLCAWCLRPAQGNYSIHADGFGEGVACVMTERTATVYQIGGGAR